MAMKRKHDASASIDHARPPPDEGAASTGPQASQSTPVEYYPRKRIAIACNVCRFRKTKCDAAKPSCGFCTDLGIECTYRKPTVGDRVKPAGPPPEALVNIERRLSQLEARLESTNQVVQNSMLSPSISTNSEVLLSHECRSRGSSVNRGVADYINANVSNPSVSTPVSYDFAYRQTATEALTARPSLLTFRAPPYIHVESWDYTAEFYDDEILADRSESPENQAPGLDYFARGCRILERLSLRTGSLPTLQCRVLQASYFKFAIRPMQTWNSITQAARDCMHLLTSRILERMSGSEQEAFHRVFWACSTILHELEATMKMHPTGLRHFHEIVSLPQFEEEDSGFYYFLAQISLRKFLTQSLEVVGYHSGRVIYAPVVTKELQKQVREWYDHLPSAVRFPMDATPVFDSRKSFLRGQYIALFVVLGWPSVLKIMEHGESGDGVLLDHETLTVTKDQAQGCIRGCCLFLSIADEQSMGRKMGTHFTLWAAYAMLATLIITFNCPALAFVEETRQEHHIRNAYEILRPWDHLPMIHRGLERIRILMRQAGLADMDGVLGEPPAPVALGPQTE
ncbi:hypothetical protein K469DRAFT_688419 [Zopfia rhizophila CBS 207.26]|uniref:Zn(2)-C6 fungal-type domain-containing protein n=1 Tax=Zopfia rhizophila CBS 207.26 TaxID=1314779 RepID=A0A6A6E0P1_9PEZI|nr:hypothetical protein K469DRAFT_688419 [Zopfia rhizophila CBS 207.26]